MEPEQEKSYEEMQADLYNKIRGQEHLCEVAVPGVRRPVNPGEINK